MKAKYLPVLLGFLLCCGISYAQGFQFVKYTTVEGLPSDETYDIVQDQAGVMWIATDHGLTSYDGNKFRVYGFEDGLPDLVVYKFYEDDLGRFWVTTASHGVLIIEQGKVRVYEHAAVLQKIMAETIGDAMLYYSVNEQKLYVANTYMCFTVDETGAFEYIYEETREAEEAQSFMTPGRSDIGVLGVENQVLLYSSRYLATDAPELVLGGNLPSKVIPYFEGIGPGKYVRSGPDGRIYLLMYRHLVVIDPQTGDIREHLFPGQLINATYDEASNSVWLCTYGEGLFRCNLDGEVVEHFLPGVSVSAFYRDREHNIWLTTLDDGLYLWPFPSLKTISSREQTSIIQLEESHGFINVLYKNGHWDQIGREGMVRSVELEGRHPFLGIDFNQDGTLVGVRSSIYGLGRSPLLTSKFHITREEGPNYLAMTKSIWQYDPSSNADIDIKNSLPSSSRDLAWGRDKAFVATGIGVFEVQEDTFPRLSENFFQEPVIAECLQEFGQRMVVGTRGHGLAYIDYQNDSVYFINDDLPSLQVHDVATFEDQLWVAVGNYVLSGKIIDHRFEVQSKFNPGIGVIQHVLVNDSSLVVSNVNSTYIILHAESERMKELSVQPVITLTKLFNNENTFDPNADQLVVAYDQNDLNISFRAVHYSSMGNLSFRYKLHGLDEEWQVNEGQEIAIRSLPPGEYQFELQAANWRGHWSESIGFTLIVLSPFWQTWWFIALSVITVLLIFYLILLNQRRRARLKQVAVEYQMKALQAQMNPHFIFNSLNSIRNFIFNKNLDQADEFLIKFAKLTRKVLSSSKVEDVQVSEELQLIREYLDLERMRVGNAFTYTLEVNEELNQTRLIPAMIVQPFLENAVLHGMSKLNFGEGHISVVVKETANDFITIVIEDNGPGFESEAGVQSGNHQSVSIKLIQERLQIIGQGNKVELLDLSRMDATQQGTQVVLKLKSR